jgi:hypothetical protein
MVYGSVIDELDHVDDVTLEARPLASFPKIALWALPQFLGLEECCRGDGSRTPPSLLWLKK